MTTKRSRLAGRFTRTRRVNSFSKGNNGSSRLPGLLGDVTDYLRFMIDAVNSFFAFMDRDKKIVGVYGGLPGKYGFSEKVMRGRTLDELLGPQAAAFHNSMIDWILSGVRESETYEWRFDIKGQPVFLNLTLWPFRDGKGKIRGVVAVGRDLTEQRLAAKALAVSERKYRLLFELAAHALFTVRWPELTIVEANSEAEKVTGYSKSELKQMRLPQLLDPATSGHIISHWQSLLAGDGQFRQEMVWLRRDSTPVPVLVIARIMPVEDQKGEFLFLAACDISREKRNGEALREAEKLLATGAMAARIAHEINNPLAGIKNSFLLIKDAIASDHPYYQYVARIEREIDRIAFIIRQMYDLYRPAASELTICQVDDVVREVLSLFCFGGGDTGFDRRLDLSLTPAVAKASESALRQVLVNLLRNAFDATASGGWIKVSTAAADGRVEIAVADSGPGVPAGMESLIFEPFFTTKNPAAGNRLGLGLSISRSLVESMGGTLTLESKQPGGAVFKITLPQATNSSGEKA